MTTKPSHKAIAGFFVQQQQQEQPCSSRQESIASENSCETVAEPSARMRATGQAMTTQAAREGLAGMEPAHSVQGPKTSSRAQTTTLVAKEQICFDFTKGHCRRGAGCKFSHDVAHIIRVNSQEKGICFDFLRGTCVRGVMCRFSHDLNNLRVQDQMALGEGNAGRARHPANVSICYDFTKNKCSKGEACRYSHDYSAILNKLTGSRHDGGSITPPRGPMLHPEAIGATSRTRDRRQYVNSVGQACVECLRGSCPRGPCEVSHSMPAGHQGLSESHEQPESLEDLINRLKKMQCEQEMVAENSAMLASPHHGRMHAGNSPPLFHQQRQQHHPAHQGSRLHPNQSHTAFSYPPLTSMYSEGARLMSTHWSGRHSFENENHCMSPMSPLSPPVTLAEKAKRSLRRSQLLEQHGIGGQQLTALSRMDPDDATGHSSPMIGAGWQIPQTTEADLGMHQNADRYDAPYAADDLINMMTTTIWPDEQA